MIFIRDKKQSAYKFSVNPKYSHVPCGKCPNCLKTRASQWSFRLMQQLKVCSSAYFITLTYDSTHIPITRNGYKSIRKDDLQKFFKRLRTYHDREDGGNNIPIKYYAVGEYGGTLKRPHYHIILFNAKLKLISKAWTSPETGKMMGHIHYGNEEGVCAKSVGYTLKYISKPYKNFRLNDDREKPFSVMSKGIGLNYLTPEMVAWHHADLEARMYCNLPGGKKCSMPRYYKERIYSEAQRERISKAARVRFAEKILDDLLKFSGGNRYDVEMRARRERKLGAQRKFILETQTPDYVSKSKIGKVCYSTPI